MKNLKKTILASALSLVLCVSALVGVSFAWFTDSVTNKGNKIEAGNLDITATVASVDSAAADKPFVIKNEETGEQVNGGNAFGFGTAADIETLEGGIISETNWEPGRSNAKLLTVTNGGTLRAQIKLSFDIGGELTNALWFDFIQVKDGAAVGKFSMRAMSTLPALAEAVQPNLTPEQSVSYILVYGMYTDAGREYMGKTFSADVTILAKQATGEADGFDNDQYDADAVYPWDGFTKTPVVPDVSGTYAVNTASELAWIADKINAPVTRAAETYDIRLENDVDLNNMQWDPIGGDYAFTGTFDGNGHTIKNLKSSVNPNNSATTSGGIALIGSAENAVIKNLKIENCDISGRYASSALVGYGYSPLTFENIEIVSGSVRGDQNETDKLGQVAGGLLGQGYGDYGGEFLFKNCINRADITVNKWHAGGLWGSISWNTNMTIAVENCHNFGNIESLVDYAGGLGGFAYADKCTFIGCTNSGTVTSPSKFAQFVAAFNDQPIEGNTAA